MLKVPTHEVFDAGDGADGHVPGIVIIGRWHYLLGEVGLGQLLRLAAGQTGVEISAATGLSLPSIQAIKKSLGLVKTRK